MHSRKFIKTKIPSFFKRIFRIMTSLKALKQKHQTPTGHSNKLSQPKTNRSALVSQQSFH